VTKLRAVFIPDALLKDINACKFKVTLESSLEKNMGRLVARAARRDINGVVICL
jgi:hypothetical protein